MKKRVLFLVSLFTLFAYSQESHFGLTLGLSATGIDNDFDMASDNITPPKGVGFNISAFYDRQLNENIGIIGNLSFDSRVADYQEPRISLNYLKFNPVAKFDMNSSYGSGFYIKPGLYYALLLSSNNKKSDELNIDDELNNSLFGVNLGFGVDISETIGLELVFDYSLSETLDNVKSKLLSGYFNLVFNVEKIIN